MKNQLDDIVESVVVKEAVFDRLQIVECCGHYETWKECHNMNIQPDIKKFNIGVT